MPRLLVFNSVTLDGYFTGENGDLSWAYRAQPDREWDAFVAENAKGGGVLVFGRLTYEMMASYWPTPNALKNAPTVAERMNALPKLVFSRTLNQASWSNTRVVHDNPAEEIRRLKQAPGEGLTILGSGSLVAQLAPEGLIDEYQMVVVPVVLGKGRTMFEGIKERLSLRHTRTRSFGNGNVLVCYEP